MLGLHLFYFDKLSSPIEDHSVITIRNMSRFIFIVIIIVQPLLTIAVSPDLNTQQVFSSSELPSDVEIFSNYTFERLVQPEDCSYSNLTKCHINEGLHNDYHLQCYKDVCRRKHYYCLDKPNDNTVHICGKADKCDKRKRSIAVIISNDLNQVNVCSIACQPGYAQVNGVNCFSPCVKDDSIIVRATAETDGKRAFARCHAEEGYCNANRKTYFEIGSSEDECVVADDDLGIRCEVTEDLMPDCSCTTKCKSNEERDWHETLMCKPTEEIHVTEDVHSLHTSSVTDRITPPENGSFSEHQTPSYETESIQPEKDKEKDKADNHSNHLWTVAIIALVVILVIGIVSLLLYYDRRNSNIQGGGDERTDQKDEEKSFEKHVVLGKKTVINPTYYQYGTKAKNVTVMHPSLEKLLPNRGSHIMDTHSKASDRPAHEHSDDEPRMQPLKNISDSGVHIEDETTARKTVQ